MRTKNSIINIVVGVLSQIVNVLLGFIARKIFITYLGMETLGLNAFFTSIISMLSLTELGIGLAITCSMYKPIADDNKEQITALTQLYAKVYRIVAATILVVGIVFIPFIKVFIKEDISWIFLSLVFMLFLLKSVISYMLSYKKIILTADQKNYIVTLSATIYFAVLNIVQIIILTLTKNYLLFLGVNIVLTFVENYIVGKISDKQYPYLKTKKKIAIDSQIKDNLIINIKALVIHRMSAFAINSLNNILISSLINVITVGLYSNYVLLTAAVNSLLAQVTGGLMASYGSLLSKENDEKIYNIFKISNFLNMWLYGFAAISLYVLINPFISMWLGINALMGKSTVLLLVINFYIIGTGSVAGTMRAAAGVFKPDKYVHLFSVFFNITFSYIFGKMFGINGIFLGTVLSNILIWLVTLPIVLYKYVIKAPLRIYYFSLGKFTIIVIILAYILNFLSSLLIVKVSLANFFLTSLICFVLTNIVFILTYWNDMEFIYLKGLLIRFVKNYKERFIKA